jgi:aminoglycoside phosphotransferase (APT) family kinase protein
MLGSPAFLMTHFKGASLDSLRPGLDAQTAARLDAELGHHLRVINELPGDVFGLMARTAPRHERWVDAFTELFTWVVDDGVRAGVELPVTAEALLEGLAVAAPALRTVTEPRFVLWDLWDANVVVDPETSELQGIIDLERAMWGDPLIEGQFGSHSESAAFAAAYGRPPFSPEETNRRALYDLYLHVIMATEGTYRRYAQDPFGDWARSCLAADVERVLTTAG